MEVNDTDSGVDSEIGEMLSMAEANEARAEEIKGKNEEDTGGSKAVKEPEEEKEDEEESSEETEDDNEDGEDDEDGVLTARERALIAQLDAMESERSSAADDSITISPLEISEDQVDFLSDVDDVDDLLGDKKKLNALLNTVYNRARSEAAKLSAEHTIKSIPAVAATHVRKQVEVYVAISDFYKDNKDLNNPTAKRFMGSAANQINEKTPGLSMQDLLTKSAARVRKVLGLKEGTVKEKAKGKESVKKTTPAFVRQRSGSNRGKGETLTPIEEEMAELMY